MWYCQFDVSPVNYSDSDSDSDKRGIGLSYFLNVFSRKSGSFKIVKDESSFSRIFFEIPGQFQENGIFLNSMIFHYEMYSWYKYLIVNLFFSRLGFWSGNLFLIAPLPDRCLLVPFHDKSQIPGFFQVCANPVTAGKVSTTCNVQAF